MPRNTGVPASKKKRNRLLKKAKGYRGGRSKLVRTAHDAVDKAMSYAYVGRKQKKRVYRRLWTVRINAACRMRGTNYSRFINGLKKSGIDLNRKVLADLAINDPAGFDKLVETAKAAVSA